MKPTPRINRSSLAVFAILALAAAVLFIGSGSAFGRHGELPNRIPEPAPYNVDEAQFFPPPYESDWENVNNPGKCSGCHTRIFDEWNGSMMSNSWRDPGWRGAFLLVARSTATDGNCDTPNPPDGTPRSLLNPFANGDCTSTFDLGTVSHTTSGSGSLLDGFCSRCHMPTNYADNVPLANVGPDAPSGQEHGLIDPAFDPTSSAGTNLAFATLSAQIRNTESGKRGIFCKVCHASVETRYTPFHNYVKSGTDYVPALGTNGRDNLVAMADQDLVNVADGTSPNLGYGVGAGAYRLSPHAISFPERFGPLTFNDYTATLDPYVSDVFNVNFFYQQGNFSRHDGYYSALFERAEYCATCHDVTNPLTIQNTLGNPAGGFPIERTYTEWRNSRYADRPGNGAFQPEFKRDCQTCHMQQHFGQPGTAQTLYAGGQPVAPLEGNACDNGALRPAFYTHHFIGGNAYVTQLIGASVDSRGNVQPYPELSHFSFSSADSASPYHHAYFENVGAKGPPSQHHRFAWDRLRNVLEVGLGGATSAADGTTQPLTLSVANSGSGHNFPTGFPEGRVAWVSVRAWDLATGDELQIQDSFWGRTSLGVGYLTDAPVVDPNYPGCNWNLPPGSPDPYAYVMKAVASLGDGCPTLALPYATALNIVTDANGEPIDSGGVVIDRDNPQGLPQFQDLDGDGDLYDDSFLTDSRLRPMPHAGATLALDRYSVVIPVGTVGPVAVTAAVYYQSFEAIVAQEFLGNLADTDLDQGLEPCVLKGACDGRVPGIEPAAVEGAPPVPMEVANWVIEITGNADATPPAAARLYPADGAVDVYEDVVVKVAFTEPVTGVDATSFTLVDGSGVSVPAFVDQVGDGTWALFPHQVFLPTREVYTARVAAPVCDAAGNCTAQDVVWSFEITATSGAGTGDTSVLLGFPANGGGMGGDTTPPTVTAVDPPDGAVDVNKTANVVVTFSEPVMNVDSTSFTLHEDGGNGDCSTLGALLGATVSGNGTGDVWTLDPNANFSKATLYCVTVTTAVTDLAGNALAQDFTSSFTSR